MMSGKEESGWATISSNEIKVGTPILIVSL
jgi:hypothetical protein